MATGKKLLHKADVIVELLRTNTTVFVHVDTRVPGVEAPQKLLGQPQVAFQLGNNLSVPIQDLAFLENGWSATLSFNRTGFRCFFPWQSVYFIVGDTGMGATWPKDAPPEVLARIEGHHPPPASGAPPASGTPAKRVLPKGWRVIEGGGELAKSRAEAKKAVPLKSDKDPQPPKPPRGYRKPGPFPPSA